MRAIVYVVNIVEGLMNHYILHSSGESRVIISFYDSPIFMCLGLHIFHLGSPVAVVGVSIVHHDWRSRRDAFFCVSATILVRMLFRKHFSQFQQNKKAKTNPLLQEANIMSKINDTNDWRIDLFGPSIRLAGDEEDLKPTIVPVQKALDESKYDYIAVFIGADHCKFCKEFAPDVVKSSYELETKRRCKVLFVSNDRGEDRFAESCKKVQGLDIMPYDASRAKKMRDLWNLATIPAFIILRNKNFEASEPTVITNARHVLPKDPTLESVKWNNTANFKPVTSLTLKERMFKENYGKWWQFGHTSINPEDPEKMYMDEHAVRMRAGLLNIISWIALGNTFGPRNALVVYVLAPIVGWEFLTTIMFGLGPLSPLATIANVLTHHFQPKPHWKPARPKQFAWSIGFFLVLTCAITFGRKDHIGEDIAQPIIWTAILMCNVATWLESVAGFCIGCAIYNAWVAKLLGLEECAECKA